MKTVDRGIRNRKTEYSLSEKDVKNRGAAMIVAIIVVAVLMVFVFSLMLVTYTLYSSQNKKVASKKCSEAANSLSVAMATELESADAYKDSDLWIYLRYNLLQGNWTFYEPKLEGHKEADAIKTFEMKSNPNYYIGTGESNLTGYPGMIKLKVYWKLPEKIYDDCNNDMDVIRTKEPGTFDKTDTRLFVEITCESASQSYTVTNEYHLALGEYNEEDLDGDAKIIAKLKKTYAEKTLYNPNHNTINPNEKWTWVFDSRN